MLIFYRSLTSVVVVSQKYIFVWLKTINYFSFVDVYFLLPYSRFESHADFLWHPAVAKEWLCFISVVSVGRHCSVWICDLLNEILESMYGAFCFSITLIKMRAADLLNKSIVSWEVGENPRWALWAVALNECIRNTIFWK